MSDPRERPGGAGSGDTCVLCGSTERLPVFDTVPYAVVRCGACGLARVSPMPGEGDRGRINDAIYSAVEYRDRYFKDRGNFLRWFRRKLRLIERYRPGKGRILDIGCSYGFFVEEALRRGWDAYGCELNPVTAAAAKAGAGGRVHSGPLETMDFSGGFDVITLWDVIEHQPDPRDFMQKVSAMLKPGGILCVQAPNFGSYIAGLKGAAWDWLTPGDHLYFFTPDSLALTARKAGCRVLHAETWEPTRYFIDSLIGLNEHKGPAAEMYRATLVRIARFLFFFLFMPFQYALHRRSRGALLLYFFSPDGACDDER